MNGQKRKSVQHPAGSSIAGLTPAVTGRKKVCWVVTSLLIVKFFLIPHIAALSREYEVTLIVNVDDQEFLDSLELPVTVISVNIVREVSPWRDMQALWQLIRIFRDRRFHVVHSISPKGGLLGVLAAWIAGVPVRIHTFQGEVWITRRGFWRAFLKTTDRLVAWLATRLLVVSASEQAFLLEQSVIPPGKSQVLAKGSICGVDIARFHPDAAMRANIRKQAGLADGDMLFLYVGRLTVDKGLLDLAAAFSRLCGAYPDVHLMMVGPDEQDMREKILSLTDAAHQPRLHFSGYTKTPEQYMAAADVLCLPSYREGFGVVIIEAAAVGIPAIASRIYGITDALEENMTGLLFEAGNIADLVDKMTCLRLDSSFRHDLGKNAALRARKDFDQKVVVAAMVEYYRHLIADTANQ